MGKTGYLDVGGEPIYVIGPSQLGRWLGFGPGVGPARRPSVSRPFQGAHNGCCSRLGSGSDPPAEWVSKRQASGGRCPAGNRLWAEFRKARRRHGGNSAGSPVRARPAVVMSAGTPNHRTDFPPVWPRQPGCQPVSQPLPHSATSVGKCPRRAAAGDDTVIPGGNQGIEGSEGHPDYSTLARGSFCGPKSCQGEHGGKESPTKAEGIAVG